MARDKHSFSRLVDHLAVADETYREVDAEYFLELEKLSQVLPMSGPRRLNRRGMGESIRGPREFDPQNDDRRHINHRLSARRPDDDEHIVIEREAELRHHVYLWRDDDRRMLYASDDTLYSKKDAAEILLLAMAMHLSSNGESVGILGGRGVRNGKKVGGWLQGEIDSIVTADGSGAMPFPMRRVPRNSTVILFGDFLGRRPDDIAAGLSWLSDLGLGGHLVSVHDPEELDFKFTGQKLFKAMDGGLSVEFRRAEKKREVYQQKVRERFQAVRDVCEKNEFSFHICATDDPLSDMLLRLYGEPVETRNKRDFGVVPT